MPLAPRICETCIRKCAGQPMGKMCADCVASGHKVKIHWQGKEENSGTNKT